MLLKSLADKVQDEVTETESVDDFETEESDSTGLKKRTVLGKATTQEVE